MTIGQDALRVLADSLFPLMGSIAIATGRGSPLETPGRKAEALPLREIADHLSEIVLTPKVLHDAQLGLEEVDGVFLFEQDLLEERARTAVANGRRKSDPPVETRHRF